MDSLLEDACVSHFGGRDKVKTRTRTRGRRGHWYVRMLPDLTSEWVGKAKGFSTPLSFYYFPFCSA